mmetsp:Transcript_174194/g.558584  ORF Transcript_174194/g.558584 Transcript_174194/m.558584 type:complete len:410 (-) Transcript_174194:296-1525(-)
MQASGDAMPYPPPDATETPLILPWGEWPLSAEVTAANYAASMDYEVDEELSKQMQVKLADMNRFAWGTQRPMDRNAYGAAVVALVKDIPKLSRQVEAQAAWEEISLTLVRLIYGLGEMFFNLVFQVVILWYIHVYVAAPSVRRVQALYADFHAVNFDEDGKLIREVWETYPRKREVCEITMSNPVFCMGILVLWTLLMMQELRGCQLLSMDLFEMRLVLRRQDAIHFQNPAGMHFGTCLIVGLTRGMSWAVQLLVCLPRAIIGLTLLGLGCQWLSSSENFADMTINGLALEFVKDIDEILYEAILPTMYKLDIHSTFLFKVERKRTRGDLVSLEWNGIRRTIFWVCFGFGWLYFYACVVQNVLPFDLRELNGLCREQVNEINSPICTFASFMGMSEQCFPYGSHFRLGR